jgi:hypothetical protein
MTSSHKASQIFIYLFEDFSLNIDWTDAFSTLSSAAWTDSSKWAVLLSFFHSIARWQRQGRGASWLREGESVYQGFVCCEYQL